MGKINFQTLKKNFNDEYNSILFWKSRTVDNSKQLSSRVAQNYKKMVFFLLLSFLGFLFVPAFISEWNLWVSGKPENPIPAAKWHIYFDQTKTLIDSYSSFAPNRCLNKNCPADPKNPLLWKSPDFRVSPKSKEEFLSFENKIRAHDGKVLWIGTVVSTVKRRPEERAIMLGYIDTPFAVYINGDLIETGNSLTQRLPISVTIPDQYLSLNEIFLAISLDIHIKNNSFPFHLNGISGGEGFTSLRQADFRKILSIFIDMTYPMILCVSHLIIALSFFYFWVTAKRKQEYFYLSLFSLVHALIQARLINFVFFNIGYINGYYLDSILRFWEGAFAFSFALSFARCRNGWFKWILPICVALPLLLKFLPTFDTPRSFQVFSQFLGIFWVVPLYFLGSIVVGYQLYTLYRVSPRDDELRKRKIRLGCFCVGMFLIGMVYLFNAGGIASFTKYLWFYRIIHLFIFMFVAYIVVSEYREMEETMNSNFICAYSKQIQNHELVLNGVLLVFDLKKSEELGELYSKIRGGNYHEFSGRWIQNMMTIALSLRGIRLEEIKGDEAIFYFGNARFFLSGLKKST